MDDTVDLLLQALIDQRDKHFDGGAYKACQCDFAYNSNHMEGSTLTHDQTVQVFDRGHFSGTAKVDDIVEARNHFAAFDFILDNASDPLSADLLCHLHLTLKQGTSDALNKAAAVGSFKVLPNYISGGVSDVPTADPKDVPTLVDRLISQYEGRGRIVVDDVVAFHHDLERIHPFSDGNGRIGRLVMFKECLRNGIVPFIITEELRPFYIRGLRLFSRERGWLTDTCLTAQDRFKDTYLRSALDYAKVVGIGDAGDLSEQLDGCKDVGRARRWSVHSGHER